jgi:hypothetical protein
VIADLAILDPLILSAAAAPPDLERRMRLLNRWVDGAVIALFAATLVLVNVQIVCRFVLSISVPWTEEVSRLLFIWLAYLGAAIGLREGTLIVIDTVPELLGASGAPRARSARAGGQPRGGAVHVRSEHSARALGLADDARHRRLDLERLGLSGVHGEFRPDDPLQRRPAGAGARPGAGPGGRGHDRRRLCGRARPSLRPCRPGRLRARRHRDPCHAHGARVDFNPAFMVQRAVSGIDNFMLLSVPFFIYAGKVMNVGGITVRIYAFAKSLVGAVRGGLAQVNVIASIIFAGMTGTAVSEAPASAPVVIKSMKEEGYDEEFAVAVVAASSTIGPIIPPSVPLVIYALMANVSVGGILVAGLVPGLLMGGA